MHSKYNSHIFKLLQSNSRQIAYCKKGKHIWLMDGYTAAVYAENDVLFDLSRLREYDISERLKPDLKEYEHANVGALVQEPRSMLVYLVSKSSKCTVNKKYLDLFKGNEIVISKKDCLHPVYVLDLRQNIIGLIQPIKVKPDCWERWGVEVSQCENNQ